MDLGFDLKDWEEVEAVEMGDREVLELGGHEVVIKDARLYKSEQTGNTSIKVCVDIAPAKDETQAGFFQRQYESNKLSEAKWPAGATRYLSTKKESLQFTKGFVKALENSNPNFKFDTKKDWSQINGLRCAGVFGLEEYQDGEGKTRAGTKLVQVPSVKLLDGTYCDYEEYKSSRKNNQGAEKVKSVEITDAMLPF